MKPNKISLLITVLLLFTMACLCTNTSVIPTIPTVQPAPVLEATAIPAPTVSRPASSGIITQIVLAKDVEGDLVEPVDPTTVFTPSSIIHAVVQIEDAPANTLFTAAFYVVDVGSAAPPNSLITSTDLTADGTRNLDFNLTPTTEWPAGTYRVDISVNGQLDQSATYTVQ